MIVCFLLFGLTPFTAIALLAINIIIDGIPDLMMCFEPAEPGSMKRAPYAKNSGVFSYGMMWRVILMSVVFTVVTMTGYYIGCYVGLGGLAPTHEIGRTLAYLGLGFASLMNIMNVRSFRESIFKIGLLSNPKLLVCLIFSVLFLIFTTTVPAVQEVFGTASISSTHWALVVGLGLSPFIIMEIVKIFVRKYNIT
jgi:magnesium-transporting ATPase (P-type)